MVAQQKSADGQAEIAGSARSRGSTAIRRELGPHHVGALMTTTQASLDSPEEIVDTYADLGLHEVFLRPISPYGFAVRPSARRYEIDAWLDFYRRGLSRVLEHTRSGFPMVENYSALVLKKMLTNEDPGYVDLRSPAGIGIGGIVYNYDGLVYAADEGRMLAEMHDQTFELGNVHTDSYEQIMTSPALLDPLEVSFAASAPQCCDCAFEPFCGADPVYHHATTGDFLGRKPESGFCQRNMGVFRHLLDLHEHDPIARRIFRYWANR